MLHHQKNTDYNVNNWNDWDMGTWPNKPSWMLEFMVKELW